MGEELILFTNRDFSYYQLLINSTARNSPPINIVIQRAYLDLLQRSRTSDKRGTKRNLSF